MLNSDPEIYELPSDCETLSRLLSPLGLKLEKFRPQDPDISLWVLRLVDSPVGVRAQPTSNGCWEVTWNTIEDLVKDICKHVQTFIALDNSRFMSNPYLGCSNQEEMEIAYDLMG